MKLAEKVDLGDNGEIKAGDVIANNVTTNNLTVNKGGNVDMGGNKVKGVADGEISATSKEAVNGSQLYQMKNDIHNHINNVDKGLRSGVAGAAAIAGLLEIHLSGKSMISATASNYKGENAIAVGYSRLSDNSKAKVKLTGSANTRGDVITTIGVGYAW